MNNIKSGDTVTFSARGRTHEGIVVRVRMKKRKKLARLEANMGIHTGMACTEVAEVTVDRMLWTVPTTSCKVKSKASDKEVSVAVQQAQAVKDSIRNRNYQRNNQRFEAAKANNLLDLERGDAIQVEYRDIGWADATFVKYNTTGGIVYSRNGMQRRTPPQFVRRKELPKPEPVVTIPADEKGSLVY